MKRTIAVLALLTALALPAGCALGPKAESSDASVSAAESAPVSAEVSTDVFPSVTVPCPIRWMPFRATGWTSTGTIRWTSTEKS